MRLLDGYFSITLATSILVSVAVSLAHPRLRGISSFAAGVLLISVILLPLVDIIKGFDIDKALGDIKFTIELDGASDDAIELAFEKGIAQYVAEEYGVSEDDVQVFVDGFDMSELVARRIYVTLSGRAALLDFRSIERLLADEFTRGGECEVTVKIG